MRIRTTLLAIVVPSLAPFMAAAQAPLSAIDWLSLPSPIVSRVTPITPQTPANEPAVSQTAITPDVTVTTLDAPRRDAVGLLPSSVTGLPRNLWQSSESGTLSSLIVKQDDLALPAMQSLLYTLLLAEADSPAISATNGKNTETGYQFLLARIDKLIELGAVEPAEALIDRAGAATPELFSRWFDLTLLAGFEDEACKALKEKPFLAPDYLSRVYCTARTGDWAAAALIVDTAQALNLMSASDLRLISQFLDPEMVDATAPLTPPQKITPLVFRLFEDAGAPLPTMSLPRAYAMADLRDTAGWKAQLTAAERLTRTGALAENRLIGHFTARHPAASGGIWDRVEAIQRFDIAIKSGDPGAVSKTLLDAWGAMKVARLEVPFARFYAKALMRLPLTKEAGDLAFRIGLLSPDYEAIANAKKAPNDTEKFLISIAKGAPPVVRSDRLKQAISAGFHDDARPPNTVTLQLEGGKLGEAILSAMSLFTSGYSGNLDDLTSAISTFRMVGLEDTARRGALQILLLNRER